ncbi:MAG: oligosaccharide flippase family protein, partial [Methylococcales bacterium]
MSDQINKHQNTTKNDRKIMMKGSIWMTLSTAISRSGSLIAQIILGLILVEEDFALYALAISTSTLIFTLKNGGARQLLIKNGENYNSVASVYYKFAFIFNLTAMALLILIAPAAAKIYGEDQISTLIYIVAISIPISTPAMLFRARLAIQKRFGAIAKFDIASNLTRQASMIALALSGYGAYSFVIPIVIVSIIEVAIGWWYVRSWPTSVKINRHKISNIIKDAKWIMIGSLAMGLSLQGDYLVIGRPITAAS